MKDVLLFWFKVQGAKSAKDALINFYDKSTTKNIINGYWVRCQKLKPSLPIMPTLGGSITVNLAALSTAFYQELTARGQTDEAATQIFYDIALKVYEKMGKLSWWMAGGSRNIYSRLLKTTQLFRAFPFNSPSYEWIDVQTSSNIVGFNCVKCPVAEYFKTNGLSKFCTKTWCSLDYPLAKLWHARLERTGSIAGGAEKCDFRWIVNENTDKETQKINT